MEGLLSVLLPVSPRTSPAFRFDWIPGSLPGIDPPNQRLDLSKSILRERPRQTGAGSLVRSGTIDDNLLVAGKLVEGRFQAIRRDVKGPRKADLAAQIGIAGSSVENQNRFSAIQFLLELFDGDPVFGLADDGLAGKEEPMAEEEDGEEEKRLAGEEVSRHGIDSFQDGSVR
jgi:hypothetical protein